jgi:protein-tyrosine phosphatase
MDKVIDNLYISDYQSSCDKDLLRKYNIKTIIYVGKVYKKQDIIDYMLENDITHYHFKVDDSVFENISKFFPICTSIIENSLKNNLPVLVHCIAGISRSPTIVLAYLMKLDINSNNRSLDFYRYGKLYSYLKSVRKNINPNNGFVNQLKYWNIKISERK